jgi:hypothetical protein
VKFTDRLRESAESAERTAQRREAGAAMRERAAARVAREQALEERNERNRERYLTPVDQALAVGLRVPAALPERREMARTLRNGSGGRTRTYNEVAALMGLSHVTIHYYLNDPTYRGRGTR